MDQWRGCAFNVVSSAGADPSNAGISSWKDLRSLKRATDRHHLRQRYILWQSMHGSSTHGYGGEFKGRFFGSSDSITNAGFLFHFTMASSSWLRSFALLNSLSAEFALTSSACRRTTRSSGPCARWRSMKYATRIPCAFGDLRQSLAARRSAPAAPWGRAPPVVFC